jgi:hypothetical protein
MFNLLADDGRNVAATVCRGLLYAYCSRTQKTLRSAWCRLDDAPFSWGDSTDLQVANLIV